MQKLRLLPLAILSLSVGLMSACDSTSSNSAPTVTETRLDAASLVAGGGSTIIRGLTSASATGYHITLTVLQGNTDVSNQFTVNFVDVSASEKSWSIGDPAQGNGSIKANAGTAAGSYTLHYLVKDASGATATSDVAFTVTGGSTGPTLADQGSVTLGAQGAAPGSFLDVANATVYTSGADKPYSTLDIVFGTDASGTLSLISPSQADGDGFSLTTWTVTNSTTIVYSATALTTSAQVQAAIGSSTAQKATAQAGWYALKLTSGKYAALQLSSPSSTTRTATVAVEIFE